MSDRIIRIAGASACENDSAIAVPQLLKGGSRIDYMVFDELAELNVANLAGAVAKSTGIAADAAGYVKSFVDFQVAPYLPEILGRGIKLLANAGGLNPRACAEALAERARERGLSPRIAYLEGDNLRARLDEILALEPREMFSGMKMREIAGSADRVLTLLAYIGALPFAAALARGADIVIAGRAADSAAALGALIHEFGWSPDDYDKLAAGSLVGHLIECSAQVTGGTFTDWRDVPDWSRPAYPIAECHADGSTVITLPEHTGGLVTVGTVSEQLLYEVSDPQAYFLPDVVCDFSNVTIRQDGPNRVQVDGARGRPRTATYKAQMTYERGWRAAVLSPVIGLDAAAKAERMATSLFAHTSTLLRESNLGEAEAMEAQILGAGSALGAHATPSGPVVQEVVARMIVDHAEPAGAQLFLREQAIVNIAMSVGVAMPLGHSIGPIARVRSFLLDKRHVTVTLVIDGERIPVEIPTTAGTGRTTAKPADPDAAPDADPAITVPLIALAWARSGDKGNLASLAVIAREARFLPYIGQALTADAVARWLAHQFDASVPARVERFFAPGPKAFNFVLHAALGGGQTESRRLDPMAKTLAQQLLACPIPVSAEIAREIDAAAGPRDANFSLPRKRERA